MTLEKKLKHYRISKEEYERACQLAGHPLEGVEWALFSALWSEHCSYKSSKIHLKKLFNKSPRVVMSFGENAGVIDLGEGEKVAFKMESHNHPSFIEPYEGAATGVGGILRDIFTMGARPVALANYLCFGEPTAARVPTLVDGVVRGIGGYGNCVGVPTITGQTEFHSSYNKNNLVNALAVGLFLPGDPILSAKAQGPGNWVVYVGAKTGKDGVHGASMASESFDDNNQAKKPTIQKGDPFYEKLLIESCLDVMKQNLVVAIQDMGAAGLTSSSFEMAARGEVGLKVHLDRVPLRDSTMTPEEILLSESQERMLMIVKPENFEKLKQVFARWSLDAEAIGEVTKGPNVELYWRSEKICDINPLILVENAPLYERPFKKWQAENHVEEVSVAKITGEQVGKQILENLKDVRGSTRKWIYNQYDQRVGVKTARDCSDSVGVIRLPASNRALGLVLGARPHIMRMDAQIGGYDSVAYPALELSAKGFLPLAMTDCLNFGNPENSEIMSQFVASLSSMSEQAEVFAAPIISGNVSFYNETLGQNITSTPATGLVGLRDELEKIPRSHFTATEDEVYLLRRKFITTNGMAGEMRREKLEFSGDYSAKAVGEFASLTRHLSLLSGVMATRVVGKFGLGYALARMTTPELGFAADTGTLELSDLTHENLYEVILVVRPDQALSLRELFQSLNKDKATEFKRIGHTRGQVFKLTQDISLNLKDIHTAYNTSWEVQLAGLS